MSILQRLSKLPGSCLEHAMNRVMQLEARKYNITTAKHNFQITDVKIQVRPSRQHQVPTSSPSG